MLDTFTFVATECKLWVLDDGLEHIDIPLELLLVCASRVILVKAELILLASTVVDHGWSLSIGISQVQLGILGHDGIDFMSGTGLLSNFCGCGVQIVEPSVDLGPHLLFILILFSFHTHLFDLGSKLIEDSPANFIHQVFSHYQILLSFNRSLFIPYYRQGSPPVEYRML